MHTLLDNATPISNDLSGYFAIVLQGILVILFGTVCKWLYELKTKVIPHILHEQRQMKRNLKRLTSQAGITPAEVEDEEEDEE